MHRTCQSGIYRRVQAHSWAPALCLCPWKKPILKQDNPDQESTDLWRKLGCLLQTFEQTHLFHLLSQLRFSHLQSVVPIQAQSCSNWVHRHRGLTQISQNPHGVSTCAGEDAKRAAVLGWWSKKLAVNDVKSFASSVQQRWQNQIQELWAADMGAPIFLCCGTWGKYNSLEVC